MRDATFPRQRDVKKGRMANRPIEAEDDNDGTDHKIASKQRTETNYCSSNGQRTAITKRKKLVCLLAAATMLSLCFFGVPRVVYWKFGSVRLLDANIRRLYDRVRIPFLTSVSRTCLILTEPISFVEDSSTLRFVWVATVNCAGNTAAYLQYTPIQETTPGSEPMSAMQSQYVGAHCLGDNEGHLYCAATVQIRQLCLHSSKLWIRATHLQERAEAAGHIRGWKDGIVSSSHLFRESRCREFGETRIALISDTQYGEAVFRSHLKSVASWSPNLLIHGGDTVNNHLDTSEWIHYALASLGSFGIGSSMPVLVSRGNHDGDSMPGNHVLGRLEKTGIHYKVGIIRFLVVNSIGDASGWLLSILSTTVDREIKFTVVILHCAPFIEYWDPQVWPKERDWCWRERDLYTELFRQYGTSFE